MQGRILRSNQGFMLVQVLIGSVLLGMLGLAFAGLIKDMWKESQNLQSKSSELSLTQSITRQLSTPVLCEQSLVNKNNFVAGQKRPLQIKLNVDDPASKAVKDGAELGQWGLKVVSFNLEDPVTAIASFNGSTVYVGDMEIQIQATAGNKLPYKSRNIGKLFMKVKDADGSVESCYTTENSGSMAQNVCASLKGVYDSATQLCNLDNVKRSILGGVGVCPDGQLVTGFAADGSKVCSDASALFAKLGGCPTGQAILGFNPDGTKNCGTAGSGTGAPARTCTYSTSSYGGYRSGSNCCPNKNGSCSKTGSGTGSYRSGGRGDTDTYVIDYFMCACNE